MLERIAIAYLRRTGWLQRHDQILRDTATGEWVPANEREPDTSEHVLVTLKWDEDDYEVTELDWGVDKACGGRFTKLATAWMYLPEPYIEEG